MIPETVSETQQIQLPLELTDADKVLLEELIGAKSARHGEYYVRSYCEISSGGPVGHGGHG